MPTNSRSDWRTLRPTRPARKPHSRLPPDQRTGSQGASRFPIICPAKRSGSTSARRPAHAAAARCIRSERASARCWTGCLRSSVSSAFAAPNMAAAPAERCARRRRRSARSQAGWRPRRCLRRSWSANIATTRRCTGSRKSLRVSALISIARRWPDGSAAHAGGSTRCTKSSARMSLRRIICLPTIRRSRCSIPVAVAPRQVGCGSMRVTNGRGVEQHRRPRSMCST
jgi:hypothetical protein